MPSTIKRRRTVLGQRALDLFTILILLLAAFIALQPGSQFRTAWLKRQADVAVRSAAKQLWADIAAVSSPLFVADLAPDVIEISDYECAFCRSVQPSVDSAVAAGVKIALLHVPSARHRHAEGAAIAAMCAEEAGRFPEIHARLMRTSTWRSDGDWMREARAAGVVNLQEFESCVASEGVRNRLAHHRVLAESLRVPGTPTFFAPRAYHAGVISASDLLRLGGRR